MNLNLQRIQSMQLRLDGWFTFLFHPTLGEPFHELLASYGTIRAAHTVVVNLNQRSALFPI